MPPMTLGISRRGDDRVAGVFALGGEGYKDAGEVGVGLGGRGAVGLVAEDGVAVALDRRGDDLFGGAGVGGAFEDDELAGVEVGGDGGHGALDVAHVGGVAVVLEGCGDADEDGVELGDAGEVCGGREAVGVGGGDVGCGDAEDVAFAAGESGDLVGVDVEAEDGEAGEGEFECEGEADVAEADDADAGAALVYAGDPVFEGHLLSNELRYHSTVQARPSVKETSGA